MSLHFERNTRAGFSLLEALIAFALLASALTISLLALAGAAVRQSDHIEKLLAAEFAVSLAAERGSVGSALPLSGQDVSGWSWQVFEVEVAPDGPTTLDSVMRLVELRIEVWHRDGNQTRHTFTTIQAWRR